MIFRNESKTLLTLFFFFFFAIDNYTKALTNARLKLKETLNRYNSGDNEFWIKNGGLLEEKSIIL